MHYSSSFSAKLVSDFCKVTHDSNIVHDTNYMHTNGKRVIVPGMLLLCSLMSKCWNGVTDTDLPNLYQFYFNSITSEDEFVTFFCRPEDTFPPSLSLHAINGRDCFSLNEKYSFATYIDDYELFDSFEWVDRSLPFAENQLEEFKNILRIHDDAYASLLFSISYASMALFKAINEPLSDVEKEIHNLLDKKSNADCVSPFYQSLKIFIPKPSHIKVPSIEIKYFIHFDRYVMNKSYGCSLVCKINDHVVFNATYNMVSIPDRLIMRMAKNINN